MDMLSKGTRSGPASHRPVQKDDLRIRCEKLILSSGALRQLIFSGCGHRETRPVDGNDL